MIVSEITLFNTLRIKLGDQDAQLVVEGIKTTVMEELNHKKDVLATKNDVFVLQNDMEKVKAELLVIKWMLGFVLAGMLSLIFKSFS
jgi:hypothetical protein